MSTISGVLNVMMYVVITPVLGNAVLEFVELEPAAWAPCLLLSLSLVSSVKRSEWARMFRVPREHRAVLRAGGGGRGDAKALSPQDPP